MQTTINGFLKGASDFVTSGQEWTTLFTEIAESLVDFTTGDDRQRESAKREDAALDAAIRKYGEVSAIDMVFNAAKGLASLVSPATSLSVLVGDGLKLASFIHKAQGLDGNPKRLREFLGGKDTAALQAIAAEKKRVDALLSAHSSRINTALGFSAKGTKIGVGDALRRASSNLELLGQGIIASAACGPSYPPSFRSKLDSQVAGIRTRLAKLVRELKATTAMVGTLKATKPQARKHSGKFLKFMRARLADGSASQFSLLRKQDRVVLSGFDWVADPKGGNGLYSSVSATITRGKTHLLRVPTQHVAQLKKTTFLGEPSALGAATSDFWLVDSQFDMLQRLGLRPKTTSVIEASQGVKTPIEREVKGSTGSWWNDDAVRDLYLNDEVAAIPSNLASVDFGGLYWQERDAQLQPVWASQFARRGK